MDAETVLKLADEIFDAPRRDDGEDIAAIKVLAVLAKGVLFNSERLRTWINKNRSYIDLHVQQTNMEFIERFYRENPL